MSDHAVIAELTRVKVLFQARAIAAIMGLPPPVAIVDAPPEPAPSARMTQHRRL